MKNVFNEPNLKKVDYVIIYTLKSKSFSMRELQKKMDFKVTYKTLLEHIKFLQELDLLKKEKVEGIAGKKSKVYLTKGGIFFYNWMDKSYTKEKQFKNLGKTIDNFKKYIKKRNKGINMFDPKIRKRFPFFYTLTLPEVSLYFEEELNFEIKPKSK